MLQLRVRTFFCRSHCCPRKVFAERLTDLVQPWARCSHRLLETLKAMGLAASAQVREPLTNQLGMPVKAPTLSCYLRTIKDPPQAPVTVLGIDDFALRRGDTDGTILSNLQTDKPLALLPDRTAAAVSPWLASHPEMQVLSRDRASGFAAAVRQVLPHATQVADRYPLIHNLRDHLQHLLDRKRTCLPLVEDTPGGEQVASPAHHPQSLPEADLAHFISAERKKALSRNQRLPRYEEVMGLHPARRSQRAIARQLNVSRNTVPH